MKQMLMKAFFSEQAFVLILYEFDKNKHVKNLNQLNYLK